MKFLLTSRTTPYLIDMKKLLLIPVLAFLLTCCAKEENKPVQWEYRTVQIGQDVFQEMDDIESMLPSVFENPTNRLNELGKDGWELVGMYSEISTSFPNFGDKQYHTGIKTNTKTQRVTFVLKRQRVEAEKDSQDEVIDCLSMDTTAVEDAISIEDLDDTLLYDTTSVSHR